jgi:hypothetical protein
MTASNSLRTKSIIGLFLAAFMLLNFHAFASEHTHNDHMFSSDCNCCRISAHTVFLDVTTALVIAVHFNAIVTKFTPIKPYDAVKIFNYESRAPPANILFV